jgi:hypothetical protein
LAAAFVGFVSFVSQSRPARAQDPLPSDVSFALKRSFLEVLLTTGPNGRSVGARWTAEMSMGEHSGVHGLAADCELHVAAKLANNRLVGAPRGIVVEPPNVCKRRVPQVAQTGAISSAWTQYFDDHVKNTSCTVTGFPRIFTEHSTGGTVGGTGGSNPDHVVEVHPVTQLSCDGSTIDFVPLIQIFPGMRRISDGSARACIEERKLSVRQRGSGDQIRYEFFEEGAKGAGGRCGNFVAVDAHIGKDYLRELSNGADHVALAQVWVGESGPFPLKLYTFKGTPVDDAVAGLLANPDENAQLELSVHGVLTYDYFTIAQAVQDENFQWLPASELKEYKAIRAPLSLVVFGVAVP